MAPLTVAQLCVLSGLPEPVAELRFAAPRRWRFDWAWPDEGLALEIDGGVWTRGRHTRGAGFLRDIEKLNTAAINGWSVLRTTPDKVQTQGLADIERWFIANTSWCR
jgi:very-short-patch-repair endonuclease|tara:strand:- start:61 stop:381 length:321 start_codon:yes stop_codon:yes gene_type:complete